MIMVLDNIKKLNIEAYNEVCRAWDDRVNEKIRIRYKVGEEIVSEVFKTEDIRLQVCVLDSLYSTGLKFQNEMAEILKTEEIQKKIKEGTDKRVVNEISKYYKKNNSYAHSFATKYCFHRFEALNELEKNKNPFVIIDSIVMEQLVELSCVSSNQNNDAIYYYGSKKYEDWEFKEYYKLMEGLRVDLSKQANKIISLREVELFLWRLGKLKQEKIKQEEQKKKQEREQEKQKKKQEREQEKLNKQKS